MIIKDVLAGVMVAQWLVHSPAGTQVRVQCLAEARVFVLIGGTLASTQGTGNGHQTTFSSVWLLYGKKNGPASELVNHLCMLGPGMCKHVPNIDCKMSDIFPSSPVL